MLDNPSSFFFRLNSVLIIIGKNVYAVIQQIFPIYKLNILEKILYATITKVFLKSFAADIHGE